MDCDVVVVGAGVVGSAVALELSRCGWEVILLERWVVASGASGGPGKRGVRANGRDARELPLAVMATGLWPGLAVDLGADLGYVRTGSLRLAERTSDGLLSDDLQALAERQTAAGVITEVLGPEELQQREPALGPAVCSALYCPADGIADHTATTRAFAARAAAAGTRVLEGRNVTGIAAGPTGFRVAVTTADGEEYRARRAAVLVCNSGSQPLLDAMGVRLALATAAPQMNFVRVPEDLTISHLVGHAGRALSIKQLRRGEAMLSGGRTGFWDPASAEGRPIPEIFDAILADAQAVVPELAGAELLYSVADRPESYTTDGVPCIDLLPGTDSVLFAGGWCGHGFAISPAVARLVADWLVSGSRPHLLDPFGFDRFHGAAA